MTYVIEMRFGLIGLGASLVLMYFEEAPMAKWLSHTVFGTSSKQYADLKEELSELDKLVKVKQP